MKAKLKKLALVSFWVLLGFGLAYLFFYKTEIEFYSCNKFCYSEARNAAESN